DHTLGLLLLREGRGVTVHATPATEATLRRGTGFLTTLERYCPVTVVPVEPGVEVALSDELAYTAVDLPTGKAPRFAEVGSADDPGRVVGYRFRDRASGGTVVYAPGVADVVPALLDACDGASALLVDGTAYADDELITQGLGAKTAGDMGHLALAGPGGLLERVAGRAARTVLVHINNSNPVLLEDSPERAAVERAGVEIGSDEMEILA
ncbi:MAG TPA: MBL fold metallo-hydrolase, partial [Actinomycetospora sp.]|uniref:MBL fold metallo-hydrolase n=1 Tax=Actinomycetospora sp. TaxID=1872135 RepID=UPI002F3EC747